METTTPIFNADWKRMRKKGWAIKAGTERLWRETTEGRWVSLYC